MKRVAGILGAAFVLLTLGFAIWFLISGPVLVEWHYGIRYGAICDPPLVVLNPLRNKEGERVADDFLARLQKGDFSTLDNVLPDPERREHVRMRESELNIRSWFSASRSEAIDEANINYWIDRNYDGGCHTVPEGIDLRKLGDQWEVTGYNPIY